MAGSICQLSSFFLKYFTKYWMGRPRWTSNCEYSPARALFSISVEMSVAMISTRQPTSDAACSRSTMDSE